MVLILNNWLSFGENLRESICTQCNDKYFVLLIITIGEAIFRGGMCVWGGGRHENS